MTLAAGRNQAGLTDKQIEYCVEVTARARFRGTRTKMPFVFPVRGQAPQDGGGERAGMPWSEGSSGSWPHGWPDGRVRIRRSVGGCCGPGVPGGKDCLLPERLWTQW